jgi:ParB family chromosome partitioning protein
MTFCGSVATAAEESTDGMQPEKSKTGNRPASKTSKRLVLGRGLDALIPAENLQEKVPAGYYECDIDLIRPNRFQPRSRFDTAEMKALADSIRSQGVIQPLLVSKDEGGYELIAGERRLRAARMAGLTKVPVVVKEVAEAGLLEISLVENIQRQDLNALEEADAYHRLIEEFGLTQEQVAERVGKSRSTVANFLRLKQLPAQIRDSIAADELSMGHARALLGLDTPARQTVAWRTVMARGLSVRETERLVRRMQKGEPPASPGSPEAPMAQYIADIAEELSHRYGTKVDIRRRGKRGKLQIEFYSDEDLDRLIHLLRR